MTLPVTVTGGAGGIVANRDAIVHLAGLHRTAAADLKSAADSAAGASRWSGGDMVTTTHLLTSASGLHAYDLYTAALVTLCDATSRVDELATLLRWAADGYPWGTTVLDPALRNQLDGLAGVFDGLGVAAGPLQLVTGHRPADTTDRVAGQDPRTVDGLIGLVSPAGLGALAAGHADDGTGVAIGTGSRVTAAPRDLSGVVAGLAERDRDGTPGGIDVRILTAPDGTRSVIVDITGTRVWHPGGRNVADLPTNERALVGDETAYEQGVLAAMRQAGVHSDDAVMIVGHSQGGLVAVTAARRAVTTGEFRVTHVVTAGSPIGLTVGTLPPSVRVLALESGRDVVPRLDGADNPDRRNVTTVRGNRGDGSVSGSHALRSSYQPLAADAQASDSRSVRDFLDTAGGFFGATQATQHTYRVERR